ncbi:MAG: SDR family NAD(P)-dependent oxidoreductase [Kiritimatiellae bacterium]|nr:SDR family NAD(P)-dependent oxidoreductase [Kiritimatiellia bacterium]
MKQIDSVKEAFSLTGRRALVTGSARGIGRAIARALAECGATVAVHGVRASDALDCSLADVRAFTPASAAVTGDLGEPGCARALYAATSSAIGEPDIIIANASVQVRRPWLEVPESEALLQMQVNFHATYQLFQIAYSAMRRQHWGRMISVGSVQEVKPHPEMPIYAASKAALENLIRNLAKQCGADGVTVNNLCPGVFATDRNAEALNNPAYAEKVRVGIPLRDFALPEDAAGAAVLLCSKAGRYITGVTLRVDGGMGVA